MDVNGAEAGSILVNNIGDGETFTIVTTDSYMKIKDSLPENDKTNYIVNDNLSDLTIEIKQSKAGE